MPPYAGFRCSAVPVDGQHRDVRSARLALHRGADQCQRPCLGAGLEDGGEERIVDGDRWGIQLVSRQGELGKDNHPGPRATNHGRVYRRVHRDVVRHAQRLGNRDAKRRTAHSTGSFN